MFDVPAAGEHGGGDKERGDGQGEKKQRRLLLLNSTNIHSKH